MDPITQLLFQGSAGAGERIYVEDVFSTWLYDGNSSTQTITNGIDLSGKGGLVWTKPRVTDTIEATYNNHQLIDTNRGKTKVLFSNTTSAESTYPDNLSSFNSNGFTLGDLTHNRSGLTYASWTFRKAAKFFDVVTWTGDGTNRTINHNLGNVPGCIIVKRTDTTGDWQVYHRSLANTEYLVLNNDTAKATGATRWNSTTPTSTEFSLGTDATVNASGGTYVAYLFAHDAGGFGDSGNDSVVKCGSYTGNGSTNEINLGWEPQWLLIKRSSGSAEWAIIDNMRGIINPSVSPWMPVLAANSSNTESFFTSSSNKAQLNPTGFTLTAAGFDTNYSGETYIYIAIRRGPMKTPTDATTVFTSALATVSSLQTTWTTNFPVDLALFRLTAFTQSVGFFAHDRLRGAGVYDFGTATTAAESTGATVVEFDRQTTFLEKYGNTNGRSVILEAFRRAPGFFDVVAYTGDGGTNRPITHNLGVTPTLFIIKNRSALSQWYAQTTAIDGSLDYSLLNSTDSFANMSGSISMPTSTTFRVDDGSGTNTNTQNYIAYLFATCPGVSKVGSYTGSSSDINVDCGFTNGARFVMIKRTSDTGSWFVWDTARGIVSGNDPYLLLNSTAAEVTNTDYLDPYSLGFTVPGTNVSVGVNNPGDTFIYLAIA